MFKNYVRIALRNLWNSRVYSAINIVGLAVGLACCLLIFLYVQNEWTYDTFHAHSDRLYRVLQQESPPDRETRLISSTPFPLSEALEEGFPEIERGVRVASLMDQVRRGDEVLPEAYLMVDPDFLQAFSFPLLEGDPSTALLNPDAVVLTEEMALKYFGQENPIGQRLEIALRGTFHDFTVSGIAKNPPSNSSIRFNFLLSFEKAPEMWPPRYLTSWGMVFSETYVLLAETAAADALEAKLTALVEQNYSQAMGPGEAALLLQPVPAMHLDTRLSMSATPSSNPAYAYILAGIALLVLAIACINFITLSVGQSTRRAKEVGIRKVLGAHRLTLMQQFWGEALLLSLVAMGLGTLVAVLALPTFNDLTGKDLALRLDPWTLSMLLGLVVLVGFGAGSYPAAFLARFQPVAVLRDKLRIGHTSLLRQGMVVFQFTLSIFLIIGTLGMNAQLHYLKDKDLGFLDEQIILIPTGTQNPQQAADLVERYRQILRTNDQVVQVSGAANTFGPSWNRLGFEDEDGTFYNLHFNVIDEAFIGTMGLTLTDGRAFSEAFSTDAQEALVVNEALMRAFQWDDPTGKQLPGRFTPHQIIGVVEDFNYKPLHFDVEPLVLALDFQLLRSGASEINMFYRPNMNEIQVRVKPGDLPETLAFLEASWENVAPGTPFDRTFLDEDVDRYYQQEERWGRIVLYASLFAIAIACLGLFGLATLAVARRTKEIGIRKTLGASTSDIVLSFSKEFARLVLLANVVAWPLAYWALGRWLEDFAYRIEISVWIFLMAGLAALGVALLTVSYQSIRAALANPVEALTHE